MSKLSPIVFLLFCCFSENLFAQAWSGVLHPSRAVDWSHVGASHINDNRTQCLTSQCGTVASGTVTAASINAALSSAPANSYVLIPAGTYTMSGGLTFSGKSNLTLRGAGSNSTFLVFTGSGTSDGCSGHDVCANSSDTSWWGAPSNTATWLGTNGVSGTYTKGATSIILSSVSNLSVGSPIILDQIDDQSDNGGLYVGCEFKDGSAVCYAEGPSGYQRGGGSLSSVRGQQQTVNVTSISGSGPYTVGITPGIYADNWLTGHSPGAWWASHPVFNDGVENVSLDHSHGADGISFWNCTGCWAKEVRGVRTTATSTGWYHFSGVCNHCTVRDSYFYGYDGDAYGIMSKVGSDILSENNIVQRGGSPLFNDGDCEGCVAAYNFSINETSSSTSWQSSTFQYHSINLFFLQEANIGASLYADSFHGSHDLNTTFRNRFTGREQNNGTVTNSGTTPLRLNPATRYHNVIGNVLGTAGYHTIYKATNTSQNLDQSVIGAGIYPGYVSGADTLTDSTSMFWGNWDVVTNGVRWNSSEVPSGLSRYANPVPSNESLPASFYLNAKPSWWPSGKAWPPIGPDVTGGNVGQCTGGTMASASCTASSQCAGGGSCSVIAGGRVNSVPAMDCYLNTMGGPANGTGSALRFDAAACYSSNGAGINPPSGLSAVAH